MATIAQPVSHSFRAPPAAPREPVFRLTVEEYHEMARQGILTEEHALELLEGWLIPKMTKHPPHTAATQLTRDTLELVIPEQWFVSDQDPITTEDSEPEPDVSVIHGNRRDYLNRHPGPADVALVVEVADTSLERDRGIKKQLYARAKIACYWIVNLNDRQVEVFTEPTAEPDYRSCYIFAENDEIPVVIEDKEVGKVQVRDMLP